MNLGKQLQKANDELLARGNIAAVPDLFAPDYVIHFGGADLRGPQAIEQFVTELRGAFPDLRYEVEILAEAGDRIAWMRTHRGTHRSDFMGVPASGRSVTWRDMVVSRYDGGKIAEEWAVSDVGERLRVP